MKHYYTVAYSEGAIVYRSDKVQNMPTVRLMYRLLEKETVDTEFEARKTVKNL